MKHLSMYLGFLFLGGCVVHKIEIESHAPLVQDQLVNITKKNAFPEGKHCFEPLLYVLTVGLIPTHCLQTYHVKTVSGALTDSIAVVTSMQGWITAVLGFFPEWRFGYPQDVESEIENRLRRAGMTCRFTFEEQPPFLKLGLENHSRRLSKR